MKGKSSGEIIGRNQSIVREKHVSADTNIFSMKEARELSEKKVAVETIQRVLRGSQVRAKAHAEIKTEASVKYNH